MIIQRHMSYKRRRQVKYRLTLVVCVTVGPVKSVTCLYSRLDSLGIDRDGDLPLIGESLG